ncbi:hypothetical protein [Dysgonomonas sp. GY617]|uniref:hypothetical protein n=1 Tax=Dysgonomonas sp. GY617 TaxID=2780420 RepID=UPI0018836D2A|nr:hypothetical protein [Dysgonomonas sp. GY617]MBF0575555.1 hypothetical protein [Dysgonomonas sp. GY617]
MKKIFFIVLCFSLVLFKAQSQESYRLNKVVLTAVDNRSRSPIFTKTLSDSLQIVSTSWDFPYIPIAETFSFSGGRIKEVKILNDTSAYYLNLEDNTLLIVSAISSQADSTLFSVKEQLPAYTIRESGNQLTVSFDGIVYGHSGYPGRTLLGKCEMIYIKP